MAKKRMTKKIYTVTVMQGGECDDDIVGTKHFLSREAANAYADDVIKYVGDEWYSARVDASTISDDTDKKIVVEAHICLSFDRKTYKVREVYKDIQFYVGLSERDTPVLNCDNIDDNECCYYFSGNFFPKNGESRTAFRVRIFSELKEQAISLMSEDLAKKGIL